MENLKDKQAILNLIGKNSVLCFRFASEGLLIYSTVIPKDVKGLLYLFEVEIFYNSNSDFFDYESLEDLIKSREVCTVNAKDLTGEIEEIYYNTFKDN